MALIATVPTAYGEDRELYIRLNNVEASNHHAASVALFRGFLSKAAFQSGASFLWEKQIEFTPDVSKPIWQQAYVALIEQEGLVTSEA